MPPRRSSRSRASVEPESSTLKRKRPQEPSARTSRASGKARESIPEAPSSDEEADDPDVPSPPVKKKRPSEEPDDKQQEQQDEDEEEEEPAPPPKRASRTTTRTRTKSASVKPEPEDPPPRRATRRGSTAPPSKSAATRTSRASKPPKKLITVASDEDEEETKIPVEEDEEVEEEVVKPAARGRGSRARSRQLSESEPSTSTMTNSSRRSSNRSVPIPEEEEEEELKPAPSRKGKGKAKVVPRRAAREEEEDEEPQSAPPLPAVPEDAGDDSSTQVGDDVAGPSVEEAEDAAEASLREHISSRVPLTARPSMTIAEPVGPVQRLVISKIVLVNFKSYAGRQEIGPFHKSFSSIVGPNGSGKSNTIDALLFVFGFRATKMRQGKLCELIHNSAQHPDLQHCSVEVHFRDIIDLPGADAYEVVPGSELIVSRTALRDNSSKYTVNNRSMKFSDVQTLLKGRGIDLLHNRFLILQGEVESIALMKPKGVDSDDGLLEYLEDIIGTANYKTPIDGALLKYEELQESRSERLNRLRLVEKERDALEGKKKEIDEFLKLSNNLIKAQSTLYQFNIYEVFKKETEDKVKLEAAQRALEEEEQKNAEDMKEVDDLQQNYDVLDAEYKTLVKLKTQAVQELNAKKSEKVKSEEQYKHAAAKLKKLKKTLTEETAELAEATRTKADSDSRLEKDQKKLDEEIKIQKREEAALQAITDSLKDKTQGILDEIDTKQQELAPWKVKIDAKHAEINVATSEKEGLQERAETAAKACEEASNTLDELRSDQAVKIKEQKNFQQRKTELQQAKQIAERRLANAKVTAAEAIDKKNSANRTMTEAKASQAEGRNQNLVLQTLTQFANDGKVQGFHGRLGSLGKIADDKYDVAVTTACGSLNNLVVDRVEQGQACIEHLRRTNAGRASIMVLDQLRVRPDQMSKKATPEGVPRLFDLITPKDPKFAPAFYKAVSETLVAEDMEQATRIAYANGQRRRVVTLEGQMIEANGTMGGGGKAMSGGMSSKFAANAVSSDVLKRYESDYKTADAASQAATQELAAAEAELDRAISLAPGLDVEYDKLVMDIDNSKRRIADAEKRLKSLQSQNKPDAGALARIQKLDVSITSWNAELEALQKKSSKIQDAITALQERILEIGGSRLRVQQGKVDSAKFNIDLFNSEITRTEVTNEKARIDIERLTASLEILKGSYEELDIEVEEHKSSLDEIIAYVTRAEAAVDQATQREDSKASRLQDLKAELDEKLEAVAGFKRDQARLQNKVTAAEKVVAEDRKQVEMWTKRHDDLSLEEVDDDDEDDEPEDVKPENPDVDMDGDGARPAQRASKHELPLYNVDQLRKMRKDDLIADVQLLEDQLQKKGQPNMSIKQEYKKKEEEFLGRANDVEEITKERDEQKLHYEQLRKQRLDEFMAGFNSISLKLKEMYQMITLGGNAELELVDSMDPFSEGIIFSVMPPKKSWKNISNLSGGEKTLSSLALVFALHVYKPTPLYFMDEIDAALDFRNVSIVANYIKDRTKNAQFIIISLRNNMFELSNRLIGIYKTSNITHSISINNQAGQSGILSEEVTST